VYLGSTPAERREAMLEALEDHRENPDDDIWLVINPDMIRLKKVIKDQPIPAGVRVLSRDHKGNAYYAKPECEPLFGVDFASITLDEFHKHGLGEDRNTLYARAVEALGKRAARRYALSGTPMGGKPIRLWGCLYFIEPTLYGSKWRWAEQWLVIDDDGFGKSIEGILPGREEAFYKAHAKHMVRRTRKDALPGLPDKVVIDVKTPMTKTQRKVYAEFEKAAEVTVEGGRVAAEGVLAEFARLKQFANARCELVNGDVVPTYDSGKLPVLLERLDEFGFRTDNPEPGARAIVASESKRMVDMLYSYLREEGLKVQPLHGGIKGASRDEVIDWYKDTTSPEAAREARILVMTTQTGGVGLNLGMTGSIHILDETWNPDDQEQLEDRGMRNRTEPLMCLYYRTEDSIQEYIASVAADKLGTNKKVLDTIRNLVASRRASA
jgi:SNF2 family DNA or RNA helicase